MVTVSEPLLVSKSQILRPEAFFVTTCFISWKDIAYVIGLDDYIALTDPDEKPETDIVNAAFNEALEWSNKYKVVHGKPPSDETALEVENKILDSILRHWSASSILQRFFKLNKYIDDLNAWCRQGARRKYLFGVPPLPGRGIEYFTNDVGVSFTVYPAFMIPYIELYYDENEALPEWDLEDIHGFDVIETICQHRELLGDEISFDLTTWDAEREIVSHE
jgi:hypothetical protein